MNENFIPWSDVVVILGLFLMTAFLISVYLTERYPWEKPKNKYKEIFETGLFTSNEVKEMIKEDLNLKEEIISDFSNFKKGSVNLNYYIKKHLHNEKCYFTESGARVSTLQCGYE